MGDIIKNVPDFDELIFENRNREYGAYVLRKRYNSIVLVSVAAASLIVSLVVFIPFLLIIRSEHRSILSSENVRYVQVQMDKLQPPEEEIFIPPAPVQPASQISSIKYAPPVIVDSLLQDENTLASLDEVKTTPVNNQSVVSNTSTQDGSLTGQGEENSDEPHIIVEVTPAFRGGGTEKFREWIKKRTSYPLAAQEKKIQGKVLLTFIVEKDGSVSNVKVIKGIDPIIDTEAVHSIEASPKWSPGLQRGQPVRVRLRIALSFTFN